MSPEAFDTSIYTQTNSINDQKVMTSDVDIPIHSSFRKTTIKIKCSNFTWIFQTIILQIIKA